ncbi:MAG: DUF1232 domain-containing protein [Ekhidna sp.]|nr:DUF1232 domain-containing protein [Ekhidna sp.]MBC6426347.1 DUF1232 domain-containing protein [Ekhidna sp.]
MDTKKKIVEEAKKTVRDRKKLLDMLAKTMQKMKGLTAGSSEWKTLRSKVNTLTDMVQYHASGKYRAFSSASLLLIVFALLYFITPTDAIPDFIPALGFTDDASVLYLIYSKLNKDIERFLQWKETDR